MKDEAIRAVLPDISPDDMEEIKEAHAEIKQIISDLRDKYSSKILVPFMTCECMYMVIEFTKANADDTTLILSRAMEEAYALYLYKKELDESE